MVELHIALLPDKRTGRSIIKLSKKLSRKFDTFFTLDGRKAYPHVTLFACNSDANHIKAVMPEIKNLAGKFKPLNIQLSSFVNDGQFFIWKCVKSGKLVKLRRGVASGVRLVYGYRSKASKAYKPHITITRLKNTSDFKSVYKLVKQQKTSFTADYIAVCKTSVKHGTVTQIIAKYKLNQKSLESKVY